MVSGARGAPLQTAEHPRPLDGRDTEHLLQGLFWIRIPCWTDDHLSDILSHDLPIIQPMISPKLLLKSPFLIGSPLWNLINPISDWILSLLLLKSVASPILGSPSSPEHPDQSKAMFSQVAPHVVVCDAPAAAPRTARFSCGYQYPTEGCVPSNMWFTAVV